MASVGPNANVSSTAPGPALPPGGGRLLPHVELPQTGVPPIDQVAGELESALP